MPDENYIGNGSTIIKLIGMTIAGGIVSLTVAHGFDLGIDTQTLAEVIGAFIGLAFGYIDAKYPNTFSWLGNEKPTIEIEEPVLNEEYEFD